jgi:hypothetical protein
VAKIRDIPRSGWLLVGFVAALVLIPTAAVAVTSSVIIKGGTLAGQAGVTSTHQLLTNGEIQGSSGNQADVNASGQLKTSSAIQGAPSGNQAEVTGAGQLLGTTVAPANFYQPSLQPVQLNLTGVFAAPAGQALVVTSIRIDTYINPTPGGGNNIFFEVETGTTCTGSFAGTYSEYINPGGLGETILPLDPGLGVPMGDALCAVPNGSPQSEVSVSGYTVPPGEVTSSGVLRSPVPPTQR